MNATCCLIHFRMKWVTLRTFNRGVETLDGHIKKKVYFDAQELSLFLWGGGGLTTAMHPQKMLTVSSKGLILHDIIW